MTAPSTPIGVGLVGYGLAGRAFHAPFIAADEGLRLSAIVTTDRQRAAQARAEHSRAEVLESVDQLLDRRDIDIVVVAAPNRHHFAIADQALSTGRHVIVDKPMTTTVDQAEALLRIAAASEATLSVFQNRRWDGDFLTLRRLIDAGGLGVIDSLEQRFEISMTQARPGWRESASEGGGPLRDLGPHLIDQAILLFGDAERVWAQIDRRRPESEIDDSVFVAIDHVGGVRSRLWMSLVAYRPGPRYRLRGSRAEYVKDNPDVLAGQLESGMTPATPGFGAEPRSDWGRLYDTDGSATAVHTELSDWGAFYRGFVEAVRGYGPPPVDPRDSIQVLRVLDAAERAAQTGHAQTP